jgi:hypothetical protein
LPGAISKICGDFELPLGREHFLRTSSCAQSNL